VDRLSSLWSDLAGRLTAIWQNQNRQTRTIALSGIAVVLVGLLALSWLYFGRGQTYQTLFSNLSAEDASAVTQHLKDDKIPYHLSTDGKTVYVPESDVSDERVAIAGSGLIKGGSTGYELFDRTNFGMTEFQEKLDKTRAVEGELAGPVALHRNARADDGVDRDQDQTRSDDGCKSSQRHHDARRQRGRRAQTRERDDRQSRRADSSSRCEHVERWFG